MPCGYEGKSAEHSSHSKDEGDSSTVYTGLQGSTDRGGVVDVTVGFPRGGPIEYAPRKCHRDTTGVPLSSLSVY
jgi:hypothetical protein